MSDFWVTIAADIASKQVEVIGCSASLADAQQHYKRTNLSNYMTFKVGCDPKEMLAWFQSIGATEQDSRKIVLQIADKLLAELRGLP